MKRVNNIYDEVLNLRYIKAMYDNRIKINTRNKVKLEKFDDYYTENMVNIKKILEKKVYNGGKYNLFVIKEPKIRLIMSQNISDKIINHLVSHIFLVRYFDKTLIDENIATRIGKGSHYGLKLLKKYISSYRNEKFYILRFDVKKYFYNLDHDIIKKIIRTRIKDKDVIELFDNIIDSTDKEYINRTIERLENQYDIKLPRYRKGKGVPIGNMSSQVIAILYLNELDHFIKEKLHIKHYIRYMDDGILLHKDKEYLKYCLKEIEKIIHKYKLELNHKTEIVSIKQGFDFLGFRFHVKNGRIIMKIKNCTKKRFKKKMKVLNSLLKQNIFTEEYYISVRNSYLGHLKHGSCSKLAKIEVEKNEEKNKKEESNIGSFIAIGENGEVVYLDR